MLDEVIVVVVQALIVTLNIYYIIIFARILSSWFRVSPYDPFYPVIRFTYMMTEPLLAPIRNMLPATMGLDFSPLILLIGVRVLQAVLRSLI